jgi:hypothetical protein
MGLLDTLRGMPGRYKATPVTLTDGDGCALATDVNGNVKTALAGLLAGEDLTLNVLGVMPKPVAGAAYSPSGAGAFQASSVAVSVKSTPGNIKSVYAVNTNAAARWLLVFNKASAPASNDVPIFSFYIPATTGVVEIGSEFFGEGGFYMSAGIAIGISTDGTKQAAATATDHTLNYTYA